MAVRRYRTPQQRDREKAEDDTATGKERRRNLTKEIWAVLVGLGLSNWLRKCNAELYNVRIYTPSHESADDASYLRSHLASQVVVRTMYPDLWIPAVPVRVETGTR